MGRVIHIPEQISNDDAEKIIKFIDDNIDDFAYNAERKRKMLRFGYDDEYPELEVTDYTSIAPIKQELSKAFAVAKKNTAEAFGISEDKLYLCSFFISMHEPGGQMRPHMDSQPIEGHNPHLDFTAMLYLNSMGRTGTLAFPIIGKRISPNTGDMVIFESKDPTNAHAVEEVSRNRYSIAMWFTTGPEHHLSV